MDSSDDLPLVMDEIKAIMSANGAVLTLHPENGERASVIYADEDAGLRQELIEDLLEDHPDWNPADLDDAQHWTRVDIDNRCREVMLIPVRTIPGHSRLLISVYFDHLSAEVKRNADAIYRERKPFAIGYFRLWQLSRQRRRQIGALQAALNRTDMSVLLIDRSSTVVFANHAAREMLEDGFALRLRGGRIGAGKLADSIRLQVALEHAIRLNGPLGSIEAPEDRVFVLSLERTQMAPLVVSVLAADERATEPDDVAAIVFVLDPSRDVQRFLEPVCRLYNLSPAETRLTCILSSGVTLGKAAKAMGIQEVTARSYLKQVFMKTATHRQNELLHLMLSSALRISPVTIPEPHRQSHQIV